ncbi:hypothetical protein C7974DRAFT_417865 [Boeremia exigua]|uniref:uncharacterized protein n=1 Tax=Boeremia exigua TaxID=749465 RepID=UPI001E8E0F53|nr:uncharacterized protein C7974DRAFT_417865 [Boeremia exigua]KAH6614132.1 hypothetical protein C7974DRAFT_417865 [Boeremia exigua]
MPTTEEQILFLYLILTHDGPPVIDWDPVCAALNLEKGTAQKRWSRLKQSIDKGEAPLATNLSFVMLLVQHAGEKTHDWAAIAKACGSTKGAVAKRWSRLKASFKRDAASSTPGTAPGDTRSESPPATPKAKVKKTPATPRKTPATPRKAPAKAAQRALSATPKRKRTAMPAADDDDDDDDDDDGEVPVKRTKSPRKKPVPTHGFRTGYSKDVAKTEPVVKTEPAGDEDAVFGSENEFATSDEFDRNEEYAGEV